MSRTAFRLLIGLGLCLGHATATCSQETTLAPRGSQVLIGLSPSARPDQIDALKAKVGVTETIRLPEQQAEIWTLSEVSPQTLQALNRGRGLLGADYLAGGARMPLVPVAETWLSSGARKTLAAFRATPTIGSTTVTRVRPGDLTLNVLKSTTPVGDTAPQGPKLGDIILNLPGGEEVQARRNSLIRHGEKTVWTGETLSTAESGAVIGDVALTLTDEGASGFLTVGVDSYAIRALGDGMSAIAKIDNNTLPPDHASGSSTAVASVQTTPDSVHSDRVSVIRVGVAVTPRGRERIDGSWGVDLESFIDAIFVLAQAGLDRSGVRIKLELADVLRLQSNETGNWKQDVANLATPSDGKWNEVDAWRGRVRADVVIGVVGSYDACGESAAIRADKAKAFAIVSYLCAQSGYSLAHEFGHLLGARHDEYSDQESDPFPYGHGFVFGNQWRTIMAYKGDQGPCGTCGRVNIWASPEVRHRGVPTGTAALNNDVRVLNENAARVAAFEP